MELLRQVQLIPSVIDQFYPPQPKWTYESIPDLTGKIVIVTGGNAGIGRETVKHLLIRNAKVYIASRNEKKTQAAIDELKEKTGKEAFFVKLDLADLKSIKAAAEYFMGKENELHILFNNAGAMNVPRAQLTVDGYDMTFGANVLGPYYFTQLLLPILMPTAQTAPAGTVRVVNSTSIGHQKVSTVRLDTLNDTPERKQLSVMDAYYQSKFAIILWTKEFHRQYSDHGIVCMSVHPGMIATDIWNGSAAWLTLPINLLVMQPLEKGALTQLWGATSPDGANHGGKYLIPWGRVGTPRSEANDPELARKLWALLEEQFSSRVCIGCMARGFSYHMLLCRDAPMGLPILHHRHPRSSPEKSPPFVSNYVALFSVIKLVTPRHPRLHSERMEWSVRTDLVLSLTFGYQSIIPNVSTAIRLGVSGRNFTRPLGV